MSINVTGKNVTIFRHDKGMNSTYSTGISFKKMDGSYENAYVLVQFKKGVELESQTKIDITNGFLSFFKNQEGNPVFKIVVLEFTQHGDAKEPEPEVGYADNNDLPF